MDNDKRQQTVARRLCLLAAVATMILLAALAFAGGVK